MTSIELAILHPHHEYIWLSTFKVLLIHYLPLLFLCVVFSHISFALLFCTCEWVWSTVITNCMAYFLSSVQLSFGKCSHLTILEGLLCNANRFSKFMCMFMIAGAQYFICFCIVLYNESWFSMTLVNLWL